MFYATRRVIYFLKLRVRNYFAYLRYDTYLFQLFRETKQFFSWSSYTFFCILFYSFLVLGSISLWNFDIFFTFFGTLFLALLLIHGFKALSHIFEDYTFSPEVARIFLLLNAAILFRLVLILFGIL